MRVIIKERQRHEWDMKEDESEWPLSCVPEVFRSA